MARGMAAWIDVAGELIPVTLHNWLRISSAPQWRDPSILRVPRGGEVAFLEHETERRVTAGCATSHVSIASGPAPAGSASHDMTPKWYLPTRLTLLQSL